MIKDHNQITETPAPDTIAGPVPTQPLAGITNKKGAHKAGAAKAKTPPRLPAKASPAKQQSKQDKVLSLLQRKEGVSIAAIMKATGWQKHSVHGFLAGVVRKKLCLNLQSNDSGEKRIYRIVAGKASKASASKRKRSR